MLLALSTSAKAEDIDKSTIWFTNVPDATPIAENATRGSGVFWGHMPQSQLNNDQIFQPWVNSVGGFRNRGLDYVGRGEFDWGWRWFWDFGNNPAVDFVQDLDGNYVQMEFLGTPTYNGNTPSWPSVHSPRFEQFMRWQVDKMFEADITHVFFDSQTSSTRALHWFGGDFSPHSINGFRAYLNNKYTTAQLNSMGIANINNFNYRTFLKNRGYTAATYRNAASTIYGGVPLYADFVYFTREKLNSVMQSIFDYVDQKQPGIQITATTSIIEPRGFIFSDRLDFFAGEMAIDSAGNKTTMPIQPILQFKAAEYYDKSLVFFPFPKEWGDLRTRNRPNTANMWIVQAYAMGSIMTAPDNVWANGSAWKIGGEHYSQVYQFIDNNSELFDNYEAVSKVGFVWPALSSLNSTNFNGNPAALNSTQYLIEQNIPYDMLVFGDPARPASPNVDKLNEYDVIFTDSNSANYLSGYQNNLLTWSSTPVIDYAQRGTVAANISGKVDVFINGNLRNQLISAMPRQSSTNNNAPYVIHLLNRRHNATTDTPIVRNNVTVTIDANLFDEQITSVRYRAPGGVNRNVPITRAPNGDLTLSVGRVDLWGVLVAQH